VTGAKRGEVAMGRDLPVAPPSERCSRRRGEQEPEETEGFIRRLQRGEAFIKTEARSDKLKGTGLERTPRPPGDRTVSYLTFLFTHTKRETSRGEARPARWFAVSDRAPLSVDPKPASIELPALRFAPNG